MPTARIVYLLIRATNLAGGALRIAGKDIEGLTGPMAKVQTAAQGILNIPWVQKTMQAFSFLRRSWLAISLVAGTAVAVIVKAIKDYQEKLREANDVTAAFGHAEIGVREAFKDISSAAKSAGVKFSEMASFMEKMGEKFAQFGLTTGKITRILGALKEAGLSGKGAMTSWEQITTALGGALDKLLPPLEKQEVVMKRLGISADLLKRFLGGDIEAIKELAGKVTNLDDASALLADRGLGQKLIPRLNDVINKLSEADKKALGFAGKLLLGGIPPISPEIGASGIAGTKTFADFAKIAKPVNLPSVQIFRDYAAVQKAIEAGTVNLREFTKITAGGKTLFEEFKPGQVLGTATDVTGRMVQIVADSEQALEDAKTAISKQDTTVLLLAKAVEKFARDTTKEGEEVKISESDVKDAVKALEESEVGITGRTKEYYDSVTKTVMGAVNAVKNRDTLLNEAIAQIGSLKIDVATLQDAGRVKGTSTFGRVE